MVAKKYLEYLKYFKRFLGHGGQKRAAGEEDPGAVPQNGICTIGPCVRMVMFSFSAYESYDMTLKKTFSEALE